MNEGKYILTQVTSYIPRQIFLRLVEKFKGDYRVRDFNCTNQLQYMLFGQGLLRTFERNVKFINSLKLLTKNSVWVNTYFRSATMRMPTVLYAPDGRLPSPRNDTLQLDDVAYHEPPRMIFTS